MITSFRLPAGHAQLHKILLQVFHPHSTRPYSPPATVGCRVQYYTSCIPLFVHPFHMFGRWLWRSPRYLTLLRMFYNPYTKRNFVLSLIHSMHRWLHAVVRSPATLTHIVVYNLYRHRQRCLVVFVRSKLPPNLPWPLIWVLFSDLAVFHKCWHECWFWYTPGCRLLPSMNQSLCRRLSSVYHRRSRA